MPGLSTVQVYLSRTAFAALDTDALRKHARTMGVSPIRWEASTHKMPDYVPADSLRLTCSIHVAVVFVEAFRVLAAEAERRQDSALLIACARSVKALFDGIDKARK